MIYCLSDLSSLVTAVSKVKKIGIFIRKTRLRYVWAHLLFLSFYSLGIPVTRGFKMASMNLTSLGSICCPGQLIH